jgi:hypothetical protein
MGIEPLPKMGTTHLSGVRAEPMGERPWPGLGNLANNYCNSMESFWGVGSRNPLNLFNCRIPSTGTTTVYHIWIVGKSGSGKSNPLPILRLINRRSCEVESKLGWQ